MAKSSMKKSKNLKDIESRKGDHISLCLDKRSQAAESVFDKYTLPYVAFPELKLDEVDISVEFLGKKLQAPIIIASMTGGSEHGRTINTNLAKAAEACGVAMGLGSQRIGLEKEDALETFQLVRKHAPNAFIIANMGVVQLNYGHGVDSYKKVVEMVDADALYLHVNPLQEAIQSGGDTDFSDLIPKVKEIVDKLHVPVFVKEVGHGISYDVAVELYKVGVKAVDTAGVGGTSYAWVEAERAKNDDFAAWFKDVGIETDQSVIEVSKARDEENPEGLVVASGGVRSPVDGLKALYLGADLFSAAVPFLEPAMESAEKTIEVIETWKQGLKVAMFTSAQKSL